MATACKFHPWPVWAGLVFAMGSLSACGPAVQPLDNRTGAAASQAGVPAPATAWSLLQDAASRSEQTGMYKVKVDVESQLGAIRSSLTGYGAVNLPKRVSLDVLAENDDLYYYQQGESAYARDDGHWAPAPALPQVDAFAAYQRVLTKGAQLQVPLLKLPQVFVNDEYCDVYQASVPVQALWPDLTFTPDSDPPAGQPSAGHREPAYQEKTSNPFVAPGGVSQTATLDRHQPPLSVLYTFYVGQRDHLLRRVDSQSWSAIPQMGVLEIDASSVFFEMGQASARIQLPKDLVRQLESSN
ncbi:MAG: hypothetical protein K6T26_06665 [Alicyclobacillus sp.]|nr:hypothetical protein [Alicyclobacillus sp.]